MNPLARKSGIFAENLTDEVILYDNSNNKVHCLNKIAAAVWESSDGTRTVDDLAGIVAARTAAASDPQLVVLALEELEQADLMQVDRVGAAPARVTSRRQAVGKMVMAGSALVATMVAAAPAAHASVRDNTGDWGNQGDPRGRGHESDRRPREIPKRSAQFPDDGPTK